MSVTFGAPSPGIQTTTLLPNPVLGDSEQPTVEVQTRRTLDGTLFTYTKTKNGRRRLVLNFRVTRMKGLEFKEFIRSYHASQVLYTDHLGRAWQGYIMNNPFEFTTSAKEASRRYPYGERMEFTVEFEGFLQ